MRRTDRLFEVIQILRAADKPVTADRIAEMLEVSSRTIYRDIATLQAMRTPIEGEVGVGYVMRAGYDLPPLNFDIEEIEAIFVGLNLLARTGDIGLQKAASRISAKIDMARSGADALFVSDWGIPVLQGVDLTILRATIREERKLSLLYRDEAGSTTARVVLPVGIIYYVETAVLAAWCELRESFRHFRADRILACRPLDERFSGRSKTLRVDWEATRRACYRNDVNRQLKQ